MFGVNGYMTIWEVVDKGNYSEVAISSAKKNKQTGQSETDFSAKFVKFVGDAHLQRPMANQRIKITGCGVSNAYVKDGKTQYLKSPSYVVWGYELQEQAEKPNADKGARQRMLEAMDDDDTEIPF
jgi:hypothetical protein